jgi:hypothetical protein
MTEKHNYAVDRYHSGIRIAVLVALIAGTVVGAFTIMPFFVSLLGLISIPPLCINGFGGLLIGAGAGWLAEQGLFRIWPSGRKVQIDDSSLALSSGSDEPTSIDWSHPVNVLSWHFVVPRTRTFVPKGWYCLACRLSQNERVITLYTFASPDEAKKIRQWQAFQYLISQKDTTGPGSEHLSAIVAEQGHLRSAERDRWESGAEMSRADFSEVISVIDAHVENWPD